MYCHVNHLSETVTRLSPFSILRLLERARREMSIYPALDRPNTHTIYAYYDLFLSLGLTSQA